MEQAALNFEAPRARARSGMQRASDHAERVSPGWKEAAYRFLKEFARTHPHFISEDVSDAHIEACLPQPKDLRAWGSIYRRAAEAKIIRRIGDGQSRRRCSPCPRWASEIYGMAAA